MLISSPLFRNLLFQIVLISAKFKSVRLMILREEEFNEPYGSQDCCAIQLEGETDSGVYVIYPFASNTSLGIQVYCDLDTSGGGWTVIQRREEVTGPFERFYRGWESYAAGFGSLNYSHWLGLEKMAAITSGMDQELRIDFIDSKGKSIYSAYKEFQVEGKMSHYVLRIRNYYDGTAGDNFAVYSNGIGFTTKDRDNDYEAKNCAVLRSSAWWYITCEGPNLNGLYVKKPGTKNGDGISWSQMKGHRNSLRRVEMKVRNRNYPNGCFTDQKSNKFTDDE